MNIKNADIPSREMGLVPTNSVQSHTGLAYRSKKPTKTGDGERAPGLRALLQIQQTVVEQNNFSIAFRLPSHESANYFYNCNPN